MKLKTKVYYNDQDSYTGLISVMYRDKEITLDSFSKLKREKVVYSDILGKMGQKNYVKKLRQEAFKEIIKFIKNDYIDEDYSEIFYL